ncbi:hypothetical protein S83_018011 [Arachis hypogaea]|uniref:Uncharacterized protein n=1 Tax=Arachis hypogaea TaxID=3818 RepID=A0A445CPQ9_ARAHY|nr:hypothetical protein Ahy_A06g027750 [Arachis hypogaea]
MEKSTKPAMTLIGRVCNTGGYWKLMTTKASNRAAVHGVKQPAPDFIPKEQVQEEIEKAKKDKEAKRKHIEDTLNSHLPNFSNSDSSSSPPN